MTSEQFNEFWTLSYPQTIPLSYRFKNDYAERWFRIHSLPESKRYADNENEWNILLTRQNLIITDLLGENSSVLLVREYWNSLTNIHITKEELVFKPYSFIRLSTLSTK